MNYRKLVDRALVSRSHIRRALKEETDRLSSYREIVKDTTKAQQIVQVVAETLQNKIHSHIASIVTRCLEAVFDDPYEFRIIFEQKRGRTEARLMFERDGLQLDPKHGVGGGVVDAAAFALRLSCLLIRTPRRRKLLVLDEPFRMISRHKQYRERMRQFLEKVSEEMDIQFIIVTHETTFQCGKIISLD